MKPLKKVILLAVLAGAGAVHAPVAHGGACDHTTEDAEDAARVKTDIELILEVDPETGERTELVFRR